MLGVRVDGRRHDPREVVREEVGGVEARIARAVAPALPILRPPGKEAEATGAAAPYATERLYYEGHYLVAFHMPRVVVCVYRGGFGLNRLALPGDRCHASLGGY